MGEVTVSGTAAEEFLNSVLTNNVRKLASGLSQYSPALQRTRGGTVDDLYVYRLSGSLFPDRERLPHDGRRRLAARTRARFPRATICA
jgi:folate-binding Fe-S cluster repair protein YgfZ